jgi:hypothetical protein
MRSLIDLRLVLRGADGLFVTLDLSVVECWNLLRTASLFFGQIPVVEKDFKIRSLIKEDFQTF